MLSLRMASSLNRCVQLQSGRKAVRSSFTSVPVPPLQRPPLKSLQSRNSRTLACQVATASDVGQGASHDLTNPHTPVLLSEVLAAFSPVNLQVRSPAGCLLPAHAPETKAQNFADLC